MTEELYSVYSEDGDMTFIMKSIDIDGGESSLEVVGFYQGKTVKDGIKDNTGKTKIYLKNNIDNTKESMLNLGIPEKVEELVIEEINRLKNINEEYRSGDADYLVKLVESVIPLVRGTVDHIVIDTNMWSETNDSFDRILSELGLDYDDNKSDWDNHKGYIIVAHLVEPPTMTDDLAKTLSLGRVGYYWDSEDAAPTVEVWTTGDYEETIYKATKLEQLVRSLGITDSVVDFDTEKLNSSYSRVICTFDFNLTDVSVFKTILGLLELQGRPYDHTLANK